MGSNLNVIEEADLEHSSIKKKRELNQFMDSEI
jgi:hypothetical protein